MKCFHGTSMENARAIILGKNKYSRNWDESEEECFYLWNKSNSRSEIECIESAYYSATKCAAIKNSKEDYVCVFVLDVPEALLIRDRSSDDCNFDLRYCIKYENLRELILNPSCKVIELPYIHERREKYLYNTYHSCCGCRWDSVKNNIENLDDLIPRLEKLENKMKESILHYLEYHFKETLFNSDWIKKSDLQ